MRWIGKKLLAACMTLLGGVLLAGAARALSIDAADVGSDLVRISRNGQRELTQLALSMRPANDAESDFSTPISAVDSIALSMWSRITELQTRKLVGGYHEREQTTFARHATFSALDGVRFSTASFGGSTRFRGGRPRCEVVPEPGTFGLLGGGLVALGLAGRRSQRRAAIALRRRLAGGEPRGC